MENYDQEVDIISIIKLVEKKKATLLSFVILGIILGVLAIFFVPRIYRAQGTIAIGKITRESGQSFFLEDSSVLAHEVKYSFSKKYPGMSAVELAGGFVQITDSASTKEEVVKNILEAELIIVKRDDDYRKSIQSNVDELKAMSESLRLKGQQIASIDLRIFDLQNQLDSIVSTQVTQDVKATQGWLNPVVEIIVGFLLGLILGLIYIGFQVWMDKNKAKL